MSSILPPPKGNPYRLSDDLQETGAAPNVQTPPPDEAEREELVIAKLGTRGWGRLHQFRHYYSAGWGERSGMPLFPRALEAFHRFLEKAQFRPQSTPSLFLTDHGTLELSWEDSQGRAIQVEFKSDGVELFEESTGREAKLPLDEIPRLAAELARR